MKTILLKLAGPLQSWGTSSHYEIRHTDPHPSKSAVIGMVAAALGYRRSETDKIAALNRLDFAVRIDQPGQITKDYQTAHQYKYNPDRMLKKPYVTNRYYLEDAVFIAAIGSSDDSWIDMIADALRHPYFQLYMGRRSCPVPEDLVLDVVEVDVISALTQEPLHHSDWYMKRFFGHVSIYADSQLLPECPVSLRRDLISSLSPKDRGYRWREEARCEMTDSLKQTAHDAFGALGG